MGPQTCHEANSNSPIHPCPAGPAPGGRYIPPADRYAIVPDPDQDTGATPHQATGPDPIDDAAVPDMGVVPDVVMTPLDEGTESGRGVSKGGGGLMLPPPPRPPAAAAVSPTAATAPTATAASSPATAAGVSPLHPAPHTHHDAKRARV